MDMEDVVLVASVREEMCTSNRRFDTAGINRQIEATRIRMVANLANDDDSAVGSENEGASDVTGIVARADSYNGRKNKAVAIPPKVVDGHGSGENSVSPCALA